MKWLAPFLLALVLSFAGLATFASPVAHAQQTQVEKCNPTDFLGLSPWYEYLGDKLTTSCEIKCFNFVEQGKSDIPCGDGKSDIPLVLLAVVDDLLRIAGLVSVGFTIYGAFQYVISQGEPEATARAQKTVMSALIGVAVAMVAVISVSFIGKKFGG